VTRYSDWLTGALRGDLGTSMVSGRAVSDIVTGRLAASLTILAPAVAVIVVVAGVLGVVAGLRAGGRVDRALSSLTLGLVATPDFLIATALVLVFAVWLPIFPAVAIVPARQALWQHPELVVLPSLALALGGFGSTMRLLRATVAQVVETPYAEFARVNGFRGAAYIRTIVANAAGPAIQSLTVMVAGMVGGGIVVETLFNVPGLGLELTRAVGYRDVPLIQGVSLVFGAVALITLLTGDVAARLLRQATTRQEDP
jgi:peptide/nickel transport system permease protein